MFLVKHYFCICIFLTGVFGLIWSYRRRKKSVQITGQIVEYYQNSQLLFVPVVEFMYQEQAYKIRLDRGFRRKINEVGGLLEIYFRPGKLDRVSLATDKKDLWCSFFFVLCGIFYVFFLTM